MKRDVVLHGELGRRFGSRFRLDVSSASEAVRALVLQVPGFRQHLREGNYHVVRGPADERGLGLDEGTLRMNLGSAPELHLIPAVAGAGGGGALWKILAGVALIVTAIALPQLLPAELAALSAVVVATKVVMAVGISLSLAGVSELISKPPSLEGNEADKGKQRESFLFGADTTTITQGGPVPVALGRARTRGVLVSSGLTIQKLAPQDPEFDAQSRILLAKVGVVD